MTPLVIVVALLVLVGALRWACSCSRWRRMLAPDGPPLRRRVRRHRRIGDARRRRLADERARRLVASFATSRHDPGLAVSAGVVLRAGEVAWQVTPARLAVWSSRQMWVSRSRVTWMGRRADGAGQEVTVSAWHDHGKVDWLITSERIVGRPGGGELISIWWATVAGLDIDQRRDRITLQTENGWRGRLSGPCVAPLAVAAVAACHGARGVLLHPALAYLRISEHPQPSLTGEVGGQPVEIQRGRDWMS